MVRAGGSSAHRHRGRITRADRTVRRSTFRPIPRRVVGPYHVGVRTWWRAVVGEPAVPGAPRRVWRDVALVGAAEIGAVLEGILRHDVPWKWPTVIFAMVVLPALLWRRSRPLPVVLVSFGLMGALGLADLLTSDARATGLYSMAALLVSLYALVRWGSGRAALLGLSFAAFTSAICIVAAWTGVGDAVGGGLVLAVTIAVALAVRFRGRARLREIEQVRLVEREQLARDLHDTVAHHVSAIAIRAQAGLAVAPNRPEAALEALELIGAEASRTLAEMRAMVGVLRRDLRADLAPTPTLADVGRLALHQPGSPVVDVDVDAGLDETAPAVATAVYRIAQEAVTNAQRHGRNVTRVVVRVSGDDERVRVRVTDDGDPVDLRRATGDGYGLRGMVERAELLGGTCVAGPGAPRGWTVEAELPAAEVA